MNGAGRRVAVVGGGLLLMAANMVMGGAAGGAEGKSNPEAGKKIYLESCQNCHGPTGKGDSDMAAYLSPPPANLTAKATQSKTDAQLRKVILEGRPGTAMTGYEGAFEEAQVTDLIAYIRSLKS
ncbi:MAG: c-type cytochrome [Nitrospira sp. CR2.1]|nr:c-type cytochrome [Nitrospira sp. CR2.1]